MELAALLRQAMDARLAAAHVALPGKIVSYDPATQTAEIQLQIKHVTADADGAELVESYPSLPNVPIGWPRGGGFFIAMPMAAGDFVTVVFCERSIAKWRVTGSESDPGELESHSLSGAWAYPGLYPDTQPILASHTSDLVIGKDGGAMMRIKPDGTVQIGAEGATFVAVAKSGTSNDRLGALESKLNALIAKYNAHTHITTATVGPSAVPGIISPTVSLETALTPGSTVASTKVFVE